MEISLAALMENPRRMTREEERAFLCAFENALLLALTEAGKLTEEEYRYAAGQLREAEG